MKKLIVSVFVFAFLSFASASATSAAKIAPTETVTPTASPSATIVPPSPSQAVERPDLTQKTESTVEPLRKILDSQVIGTILPWNIFKYAIRQAVGAGVPVNTIVLILLLPLIATIIAAVRQLVGLRGFGIFLPASLSVVFVATGPVVGIVLFLIIVFVSTATRMLLRKAKIKLQYLPRMALILWVVSVGVLCVLFLTPVIRYPGLTNVSIFAVLILALLTEDFIRVQLGKSVRTAIRLTYETIILSTVSYLFLTFKSIQEYALLHPEIYLGVLFMADLILGRYTGLRVMELWRFRKLINSK
ncbi:MAG: hypothetical protein UT39_C0015G0015 [Candidatus Woesebacteria bacterium GW2011_GWA1_39_21]|uniref:7 transmembrane helices usually fused to an inactive transglutaminase domain-containing protein n=1 Tax=Candidatus Woesebacteria bacterium GW2011_GWA1_39_21 TaxID=1618550 RepID=A0A0G0RAS8_9BACT|nr:MAG: hypothetical protein UT39_C0015G0015 [Candidatus Woesebacteria bacterium GW2011_GWA1_39_21]